ncbi:hypothetical protein BCR41DRAFT_372514 [Lobosporangium transversale]|uniref:Uncharacterized protein n=1 Tax=Lobosporangium transversale TaxID=64571 RepID=A0A1Y2GGL7_9FUNG|nr:hypothetical protein BCR41DRAFT_372514 [Lobosporangium transversale]ORZ10340.1 hypothetical protein BCR41DRAFT_372514 [Lobosporangium transversale]|eukprot:XP_021879247.1 hypothetical protein BCR41DRAFT_372514 [Lobosporangium transversale]
MGGKLHLKLNIGERPIPNSHCSQTRYYGIHTRTNRLHSLHAFIPRQTVRTVCISDLQSSSRSRITYWFSPTLCPRGRDWRAVLPASLDITLFCGCCVRVANCTIVFFIAFLCKAGLPPRHIIGQTRHALSLCASGSVLPMTLCERGSAFVLHQRECFSGHHTVCREIGAYPLALLYNSV